MIRPVTEMDIPVCVEVIRESFLTVAEEFHFTKENAPRFTAFSVNEGRLFDQFHVEHRPMCAYVYGDKIVGYYSLFPEGNNACELNNLAVLPAYRHKGIGKQLLEHAEKTAAALHCTVMHIGIVEENRVLRRWYEKNGAVHTGTKKFDFFPFTCGYLQMPLPKIMEER